VTRSEHQKLGYEESDQPDSCQWGVVARDLGGRLGLQGVLRPAPRPSDRFRSFTLGANFRAAQGFGKAWPFRYGTSPVRTPFAARRPIPSC
jgi:hypothetical protein